MFRNLMLQEEKLVIAMTFARMVLLTQHKEES